MAGRTLGPYEIESGIGAGRLGTVHLARVVAPGGALPHGERVVLKVFHRALLDSIGVRTAFLEDALPARHVRHPNVVRCFDAAVAEEDDEATFFVATEYVRGKTVRAVLDALGRLPEALLREIATAASAALAAVHAQEILHLDVTPDNLIVGADHQVRLMDVGVASLRLETLRLAREGAFVASVAYVAPELFRGAAPGPAADLYALGVVLYELATGTHPFEASDMDGFRDAHLHTRPERADLRVPQLTPFFVELIDTLLAKDEGARFPSAAALNALLQEGEASSWWVEREVRLRADGAWRPRVHVRRDTPVFGRAPELRRLRERFHEICMPPSDTAKNPPGRVVLVEGVAGVGKTRLADEFLSEIDPARFTVLYGAFRPRSGRDGLCEAVVDGIGAARIESELTRLLPLTPDLVAGALALLLYPDDPGDARPITGDAALSVFVQLVQSLAAERPLLWVVEDVQFASEASLSILRSMARAVHGHRALLIVTGRPGVHSSELARFERVERMPLGPLTAEALAELIEARVGATIGGLLRRHVAPRSGGVPFFALEILGELEQRRLVVRTPDGGARADASLEVVAGSLQTEGLLTRRFGDLPSTHRALLDVAALSGHVFDASLIAAATGTTTLSALLRLAEIAHNLGCVDLGGATCRFTHHLIHEEIDRAIPRSVRGEYHALLADALRARVPDVAHAAPGDLVSLASHCLRGARALEAAPFVVPAMDRLWHAHRNARAAELGRAALEVPSLLEGRARLDVLVRLARSLELMGESDEHLAVLDQALRLTWDLDDPLARARILRLRGMRLASAGDHEGAIADFEEARVIARERQDRFLDAQIRRHVGLSALELGRYDQAAHHLEKYLGVVRETRDDARQGDTLTSLARIAYKLGHLGVARAHYTKAVEMLRTTHDVAAQVRALAGLATVLLRQGELDVARDTLHEHLELVRRLGLRSQEAFSRINLAALYMSYGEPARSREHLAAHLALARELGDARLEAVAAANLGSICVSVGDADGARAHLEPALATFRRLALPEWEAFAVHELARVSENLGDLLGADAGYREALGARRRAERQAEVAETLLALARVAAERGAQDDARWCAEEAYALAKEFDAPGEQMVAAARLAVLGGLDARTALDVMARNRRRAGFAHKLETAFLLWRATGEFDHLEEAHRLLESFRSKAREVGSDALVMGVAVHRGIGADWARHGGNG